MKKVIFIFLIAAACNGKSESEIKATSEEKKEIVKLSPEEASKITVYWEKANRSGLHSIERQKYLDSILMIKPDSAYFWQQKAMPLYKARKYTLGKPFLAKAVEHDPRSYLDYSAFMKCLFSKEYNESIAEFMEAKEKFGDSYVMDHTYNFYIGLDYLQLNEFEKAKVFLEKSKQQQFVDFPNNPPHEACHYLDWFYLGIVEYELQNYKEAIRRFDTSLMVYENFADAMYYKAQSLYKSGKVDAAKELIKTAFEQAENTINEDQVYYEIYPYQVFHRLSQLSRPR